MGNKVPTFTDQQLEDYQVSEKNFWKFLNVKRLQKLEFNWWCKSIDLWILVL